MQGGRLIVLEADKSQRFVKVRAIESEPDFTLQLWPYGTLMTHHLATNGTLLCAANKVTVPVKHPK